MAYRWLLLPLLMMSALAHAHTGTDHAGSTLLHGFWHPLSGSDHLLALLAAGVVAASYGGRMLTLVPLVWLLGLPAGALLGTAALPGGLIEFGLIAAVVVLGLMLAYYRDTDSLTALGVVAALALLQGFAHAGGVHYMSARLDYGLGFALAGLLLLLIGTAAGFVAQWLAPPVLRGIGVVIAAMGLYSGLTLIA